MIEPAEMRWRRHAMSPIDDRIDAVCDEFERAWNAGQPPEVSDFLARVSQDQRSVLLRELALIDVDYRRQRGLPVDRAAYRELGPGGLVEVDTRTTAAGDLTTPAAKPLSTAVRHSCGDVVGRFQLVERVGGGGGGEVWKAVDPQLRRTVAVKIAHPQTDDELHRFVREGRAVAQLRHPHIVAVHDAWCADGVGYLVTDFYDGSDLKRRLAVARPSPAEAAELCATLADALHYAHGCGVIHRDMKPANILLDQAGRPHIADFGLAKWEQDSREVTLDGQLLGTVAYMSPEQASGRATAIDRRSDVYALGAILYEMLTGRCPFTGDQATVLHAIGHESPPSPRALNPATPRNLETICLKAMNRESAGRYATAGEMAADLRRYLRGDPIQARPPSAAFYAWTYLRRRPALVACLVLAFAVAAASMSVRSLRARNRELLGFRSVSLATKPPGARVAFIPLSKASFEPQPWQLISAPGRSPVTLDLLPGDYLIVAALDDGRFHEVYRHVPDRGELRQNISAFDDWTTNAGDGIDLRSIIIPDSQVTDDMALIKVESRQSSSFSERRRGRMPVQPFYVDVREYSVANLSRGSAHLRRAERSADGAALVTYGAAASTLESLGKRLPTAAEYEFAATAGERQRFPWGDGPPARDEPRPTVDPQSTTTFATDFDRLTLDPRIRGLCTGAPEWTSSRTPTVDAKGVPLAVDGAMPRFGIVAGLGPAGDKATASDAKYVDPRVKAQLNIDDYNNRAGFRGYRSLKPRLEPEDFFPAKRDASS